MEQLTVTLEAKHDLNTRAKPDELMNLYGTIIPCIVLYVQLSYVTSSIKVLWFKICR